MTDNKYTIGTILVPRLKRLPRYGNFIVIVELGVNENYYRALSVRKDGHISLIPRCKKINLDTLYVSRGHTVAIQGFIDLANEISDKKDSTNDR